MNATQADRMQVWINGLRNNVVDKEFNMDCYVEGKNPSRLNKPKGKKCGTVGCASGYLPVFFPKDWVWIEETDNMFPILLSTIDNFGVSTKTIYYADGESKKIAQASIKIDGDHVIDDISDFFGIKSNEVIWLIIPASYDMVNISKRTVINRMLELGEKYEWELE